MHDLAALFVRQAAEALGDDLLRPWESRCGVRIVGRPHDVLWSVAVQRIHEHGVGDERGVDLTLDVLACAHRQLETAKGAQSVLYGVKAVHEIRHPAHVILGGDDLETGELLKHAAKHQYGNRALDLMVQCGKREDETLTASRVGSSAAARRQDV